MPPSDVSNSQKPEQPGTDFNPGLGGFEQQPTNADVHRKTRTGPPSPTDASGSDEKPKDLPRSDIEVGPETPSQQTKTEHVDHGLTPASTPLFDEIRALRKRLLHLENQATQQRNAQVEEAAPKDTTREKQVDNEGSEEDINLRRHIRKAPYGRRWVKKTEQQAEEDADERKQYGQGPNNVPFWEARGTMHHVQESGDMLNENEDDAIIGPDGWYDTHYPPYDLGGDVKLRRRHKAYPHRGIRPPTAIRPFYEKPNRQAARGPYQEGPRLSRKLGPPTRWDQSDSEEWSSDTSTRSQDFNYFRARLRGDFEWELDRLNAQVLRFRNHKERKAARELATKTQQEINEQKEGLDAYATLVASPEHGAESPVGEHGIQRLNVVRWSVFKLTRVLPLKLSCVIDVLVEEPKLWSDPWGRDKNFRTMGKQAHKKNANSINIIADAKADGKDDAEQDSKQATQWAVQGPLPERIRIHSQQIIDILSSIHGSPLCPDAKPGSSVLLLRPFRILNVYDKEIREMCLKLAEDADGKTESSMSEGDKVGDQVEQKGTQADDAAKTAAEKETHPSPEERLVQREHLNYLRQFMDEYIGRKVAYLSSVSCRKITFPDVWYLFQPGTTVISANGKQAFRVISVKSKRHKGADRWAAFRDLGPEDSDSSVDDTNDDIKIKCVYIHFDGHVIGPVVKNFGINKWDGEREVTWLEIYPLRFHILKRLDEERLTSTTEPSASLKHEEVESGIRSLREKLIKRGRMFVDVAAVKHMYYSGLAADTRDEIESQVMVDFEEAFADRSRDHWIPKTRRLVGTNWNSKTDDGDEGCMAECCWEENVHEDAYVETNNTEKFIDSMMAEIRDTPHKLPSTIIFPRSLKDTKTESNALTDDELLIMSYTVFGFVLRDRTWGKRPYFLPRQSIAAMRYS